jgi:peptide/nickel transport system substrate-binding protein
MVAVGAGAVVHPHLASVTPGGNGTASINLNQPIASFNINTYEGSEEEDSEVMGLVWPEVYIVQDNNTITPNLDLLTQAPTTTVTAGVQKTVYKISSSAKWYDGTPIDAVDFQYNWQALSGSSTYKDIKNKPYDIGGDTGYDLIKSVTGSAPFASGTGTSCKAAYRGSLCPNGLTVTVTYKKHDTFADWKSLFGSIAPEHILAVKGWNKVGPHCSSTLNNTIMSGSWYYISNCTGSLDTGETVTLTRNPNYWGTAAALKNIVFVDAVGDDDSGIADLASGTINVFYPNTPTSTYISNAQANSGVVDYSSAPGDEFEHVDFNENNPYLSKLLVREAVAHAINRQTIVTDVADPVAPGTQPLGNRLILPGQVGYVDGSNGGTADTNYTSVNDSLAASELTAAGYHMGTDGKIQTTGTGNKHDMTFQLLTTTAAARASECTIIQSDEAAIGITVKCNEESSPWCNIESPTHAIAVANGGAQAGCIMSIAGGSYDLALFAWVGSPFLSGNEAVYSNPTTPAGGENWTGFNNATVTTDLANAATATTPTAEQTDCDNADTILWQNMDTLPLYQKPIMFAWTHGLKNVIMNPTSAGPTWDGNEWGYN